VAQLVWTSRLTYNTVRKGLFIWCVHLRFLLKLSRAEDEFNNNQGRRGLQMGDTTKETSEMASPCRQLCFRRFVRVFFFFDDMRSNHPV
jgi:hypothetical protein